MAIFGTNSGYMSARPAPPGMQGGYGLYNTAIQQQAGDYGNIMKGYQGLLDKGPSADIAASTANLKDLSATGGISDADAANMRARGISPIRAAYATAQRNTDRQRGLQGGYAPNYGAVQAKMAREQSEQLAAGSTNVEAALAEMRQKGKLQAGTAYSDAAGRQDSSTREALQGMTSLYGTTPALASLYGNQALQGAQLQNNINQSPAVPPPGSGGFGGGDGSAAQLLLGQRRLIR